MPNKNQTILKAFSIKAKKQDSYNDVVAFKEQAEGIDLVPPYDPTELYSIYEHTALLRPNVEAYSANIDLFGFDIVSLIPLGTDSDSDTIRAVIFEDMVLLHPDIIPDSPRDYSDEDVEREKIFLEKSQGIDKIKADSFFRTCSDKYSFNRLRAESRHDLEVTGNAYWELLRSIDGKIKKFIRVLPSHIRCRPLSTELYQYNVTKRISRKTVTIEQEYRRARTYIVDVEGSIRYFKEFTCTAVVSSLTGKIFKDLISFETWKNSEGSAEDVPANEIKHFTNYSNLADPYGVPRWIGSLTDVVASKAISDFNVSFFDNGFMSPLAVLVSGGSLSPESVASITEFISEGKGANAHKVMVLEAVASGASDLIPTITFKDLRSAIDSEGSFLQYDKNNSDRVGTQFRISDIVRGSTNTTANRATADAAIAQADAQVFTPLRNEFDWFISEQILPALGLNFIKFVSRGHTSSDTQVIGTLILDAVAKNVLRPNEARELLEPIFRRSFAQVTENWGNYPPQVLGIYGMNIPEALTPLPVVQPNDTDEKDSIGSEISRFLTEGNRLASIAQGIEAQKESLSE
jgi:capsid portal protein